MLNEIAWRYLQWGEVPLVLATFAFIWFGGYWRSCAPAARPS